jgi:TM2 domain-containing membrane protein YozV
MFGAHRFYVGKFWTGALWFLTLGFFGFGWMIDLLAALSGGFWDKRGFRITRSF